MLEFQNGTDLYVSNASTGSPDINSHRTVDAVDVQLVINAGLGLNIGQLVADVNNDSAVDAVDIQLVINAALAK